MNNFFKCRIFVGFRGGMRSTSAF